MHAFRSRYYSLNNAMTYAQCATSKVIINSLSNTLTLYEIRAFRSPYYSLNCALIV